jgi:hypothetical protein
MSQNSGEYTIQENILRIGDALIVFEDNIKEALEISGMLIVLLVKRDGYFPSENVFGVNLLKRKIEWRIEKLKYETGDACPFVGIKLNNNQLYLNNWCDIYLIVDPLTGSILFQSAPAKR